MPVAFFAGLLALALGRGTLVRLLGGKALTYLGEISYSTYLGHYGLFILFKIAFVDASLQLGWIGLASYLALVPQVVAPPRRWAGAHGDQEVDVVGDGDQVAQVAR